MLIIGNESLRSDIESLIIGNKSLISGIELLIIGNESLRSGIESLIIGNKSLISGIESLISENELLTSDSMSKRKDDKTKHYRILNSFYSPFSESTGLAVAARQVIHDTENNDRSKTNSPANANIHQSRVVL